ncbi:ligase-associated DNA damage response endonuclease PdeM [Methylocapsa palsarum]|uniref:Calcineurin-like phosphoesterase domain-containing protein n=1 Tax=Methylocapsa palsarum TaxID=1612308 RepID=A0A1I3VZN0_9HYPH|nr:hypothetical protein SAMN05444581_101229 [Methylocapsa palsarum]
MPRQPAVLKIMTVDFIADPAGALYWLDERMLIVADLHFEKGSAFAAKKIFLPPYDTAAALAALAALVAIYNPKVVLALGDSFHDGRAGERIAAADVRALRRLQAGRDWIWIAGNHDRILPSGLEGERRETLSVGEIAFRHEPGEGPSRGEIAGHLHPVAKVVGRGGRVRRRCFVSDGSRCVMPAFGAYAGGLNLHDAAFAVLFRNNDHSAHVLGREKVYSIPLRRCLPD